MIWISILVVAIFIWLVFNNPLRAENVHDTYECSLNDVHLEKKNKVDGEY